MVMKLCLGLNDKGHWDVYYLLHFLCELFPLLIDDVSGHQGLIQIMPMHHGIVHALITLYK